MRIVVNILLIIVLLVCTASVGFRMTAEIHLWETVHQLDKEVAELKGFLKGRQPPPVPMPITTESPELPRNELPTLEPVE